VPETAKILELFTMKIIISAVCLVLSFSSIQSQQISPLCETSLRDFITCVKPSLPTVPEDPEISNRVEACCTSNGCYSPICVKDAVIRRMPDVTETCFGIRDFGFGQNDMQNVGRFFQAKGRKKRRMFAEMCAESNLPQDFQVKTNAVLQCLAGTRKQNVPKINIQVIFTCAISSGVWSCKDELKNAGCNCAKDQNMQNIITQELRQSCGVAEDLSEIFGKASEKVCKGSIGEQL
jgi:hypothetical protein